MSSIHHLAELFERFPGIGPRQASRFVQFLVRQNMSYLEDLSHSIKQVRKFSKICERSFAYFYSENPEITTSPIERDPNRDKSLLMIVEKDSDADNIEKLGTYNGLYFILGGVIPVLDPNQDSSRTRLSELISQIDDRMLDGLDEVIIATSATPEGDASARAIRESLKKWKQLKTTSLARGLSTGTELEYVDRDTLASALLRRT